jgi:pyridoxine 4-dehydrogenase
LLGGELEVNRIGFGAMRFMSAGVDGAKAILRRAVELGVTLIDTADVYGRDGASEKLIAQALRPYPAEVVIATKGGQVMVEGVPRADGTPPHLRSACEASLRRLGLDTIDLYQLHNPDPNVPLDESLGALGELRQEGKVRQIGVCNLSGRRLEQAHSGHRLATVQNRLNLDDRGSLQDLATCERRNIAFMPYAPLGAGSLPAWKEKLATIADAHNAAPVQVALAWLLDLAPVTLPIPGTSSLEHLEQNAAAAAMSLTEEDRISLASA